MGEMTVTPLEGPQNHLNRYWHGTTFLCTQAARQSMVMSVGGFHFKLQMGVTTPRGATQSPAF